MRKGTFRFRRRIKLFGPVSVNLAKHGVSVSVGRRGQNVTVNKDGAHLNVGAVGTGLSYRVGLDSKPTRRTTGIDDLLNAEAWNGAKVDW